MRFNTSECVSVLSRRHTHTHTIGWRCEGVSGGRSDRPSNQLTGAPISPNHGNKAQSARPSAVSSPDPLPKTSSEVLRISSGRCTPAGMTSITHLKSNERRVEVERGDQLVLHDRTTTATRSDQPSPPQSGHFASSRPVSGSTPPPIHRLHRASLPNASMTMHPVNEEGPAPQ